MAGLGREQHATGNGHTQQCDDSEGARSREQACRRGRGQAPKQTDVHDGYCAGKQRKRDDMTDIGRGIEPWRLTDGRGEAGLFEGDKNCRRRIGHQRIS